MEHSGTIIQIFATPAWGGGEQFVYDLTRRLLADGRRVELVSRRSRIIGERTAGLETGCHTMPLKGAVDLWSALLLALLILRTRASVVHVHHFKDAFTAAYACLLSRLFGVRPRIVLTRHLVRRGKRGWLYGWLYGRIDRIAFVSELARREFLAGEPPVDPARLCVIHNSVPEPVAASDGEPAADLRRRFGIAPATPLLLFCGRWSPKRGATCCCAPARGWPSTTSRWCWSARARSASSPHSVKRPPKRRCAARSSLRASSAGPTGCCRRPTSASRPRWSARRAV